MDFNDLRKNLNNDYSGMKKIKLAIVADWAIQMMAQAIRGYGYNRNLDVEIYEGTYDQMESEIMDNDSLLYEFDPDYVLIFPCAEKLREKFYPLDAVERKSFAENEGSRIISLCGSVEEKSDAKVILADYCSINDGIYGNYAGKYAESFSYMIGTLNKFICDSIADAGNVFLLDINAIQNQYGRSSMFDDRLYYISKTVFSMDTLSVIAENVVSIIVTLTGKIKKCLITDLDNTLWGGVIGDDGMEGIQIGDLGIGIVYSDIQRWIKELSKRGVAIAVCSKNDEDKAKEPFEKHPDMVLKMDDISVFVANWNDKASNIKEIQAILNIGFDSMVFIDDNPFERNLVKQLLPDVEVPDLPEDPSQFLKTLQSLNIFETVGISDEDKKRTELYREESQRTAIKSKSDSIEEFLCGLNMTGSIKSFDKFSIPRVAQLTQRSNQFNLRTVRYSEEDIIRISNSDQYITMSVSLKDKFGEYGIICVVILKKEEENGLFIDTLLMSCRVLKRSVEEYVFNNMVSIARENGFKKIRGEYVPTAKNGMVKNLYSDYGFEHIGDGFYELSVSRYNKKNTYVEEKK